MIGNNIKKLRESRKLSINLLAKICKMSPGYLSDLEKGIKTNPGMDKLEKIASALDVTVQQLFKEDIDTNDEIDELEKDIKSLYPKIAKLSKTQRQKFMKMVDIMLENNDIEKK